MKRSLIGALIFLISASNTAIAEDIKLNHLFGFDKERDKEVCQSIVKNYGKVMDYESTMFHTNQENLMSSSSYILAKASLLTLLKFLEVETRDALLNINQGKFPEGLDDNTRFTLIEYNRLLMSSVLKFRKLLKYDQLPIIEDSSSDVFKVTRATRESRVLKLGQPTQSIVPYFSIPKDLIELIEKRVVFTKVHLASAVMEYIDFLKRDDGKNVSKDDFVDKLNDSVDRLLNNRHLYTFNTLVNDGMATKAMVKFLSTDINAVPGKDAREKQMNLNDMYSEELYTEETSYGEIFSMMASIQGVDENDFFLASQCEKHGYIPTKIDRTFFDERNIKDKDFSIVSASTDTKEIEKYYRTEFNADEFEAFSYRVDEYTDIGLPYDAMGTPYFINDNSLYMHVKGNMNRGKFYKIDLSKVNGVFPSILGGEKEKKNRFRFELRKVNGSYGVRHDVRESAYPEEKQEVLDEVFNGSEKSFKLKRVEITEGEYSKMAKKSSHFDFKLYDSVN